MRVSIIAWLALTGATAAVAVAAGAAYATDGPVDRPLVQIVTEQEPASSDDAARTWSDKDCPEQGGTTSGSPGPDGSSGQEAL
jgi:hypothetical protein